MKSLVKSFALVMMCVALFSFSANASADKGKEKKQKSKKAAVVFSAEEIELGVALDSFYEDLINDAALRLSETSLFDRVEVYDMKGKLVKKIELNGQTFSELMVPVKAERMMIDNRTAFYIVVE
jgi:hypothetical protein